MWDSLLHTVWSIRPVFILLLKPGCVLCVFGVSTFLLISAFYLSRYVNRELKKKRGWNAKTGCSWKERWLRRGRKDLGVRPRRGGGKFRGWSLRPTLNWRSLLNDIMGPISGGVHPFFSRPMLLLRGGSNSPGANLRLSISNCLSELSTRRRQSHVRECLVHAWHVQLNHGSLPGNTVLLVILNNGDLASLSSKGHLLSELSTQVRIRVLGKNHRNLWGQGFYATHCERTGHVHPGSPCTLYRWVVVQHWYQYHRSLIFHSCCRPSSVM